MLKTKIGRLRLLSLIEGLSLVLLVFLAVPMKYLMAMPMLVKILGPIHGGLFVLFVFMTIAAAFEYGWKFKTTALLLVSSIVPFGCFYAEKKIFRKVTVAETTE